jgi:hypothetical protein
MTGGKRAGNEAIRMMRQHPAVFTFVIVSAMAFHHVSLCHAVLIDDFSIDQVGYSTNQNAAYDVLQHPGLLGGAREIWGGGASIPGACSECEIAAKVTGGRFQVFPGNDCPGTGNLTWGLNFDLGLDLSESTAIQIQIAELTGVAQTRISIYSGPSHFAVQRLDVYFATPGIHTIPFSSFPGPITLQSINLLAVSTYLDLGEFVAFDSISAVPEPSNLFLAFTSLATILQTRFHLGRTFHSE